MQSRFPVLLLLFMLLAAQAGATDLILQNQHMWFSVPQDTTQTTYFIMNAGGVARRPSLLEKWLSETLIDNIVPDFKGHVIESIGSDPRAAWVTQRFDIAAPGKKLMTYTGLELPDQSKWATFNIRYINTGDQPLRFAEPGHNVGRGHLVLHIGFLEQKEIACTVNGIGEVPLASMQTFQNTDGVNTGAPFCTITNKRTNESVTFGFIGAQPHPINHIMAANGSIFAQSNIYFYTDEYSLNPGESETYTGIISFHPGGAEEGAGIYNEAARKAGIGSTGISGTSVETNPSATPPPPTGPRGSDPFNPF